MRFGRGAVSAGLAAALAAASFLWRPQTPQHADAGILPAPAPSDSTTTVNGTRTQLTQAELVNEIERAQRAIAAQIGQPPPSGPIEGCPPYISAFEWGIFQGVAKTHSDPQGELTLLVNRLRFTRLESLWRSMQLKASDPALRHRLARQLLDEIPGRVLARQLDLAQAQSLQQQLLDDLVSNPDTRLQRTSQESQRLSRPGIMQ